MTTSGLPDPTQNGDALGPDDRGERRDPGAGPHPLRVLAVLSFAGVAYALGQTMLIPALGGLQRGLGTDSSGVALLLSGFLIAAAVSTPIVGRLGDMLGRRRVLVFSLGVYAFGCVVSALGTSLEVVVAGRVIQGIGGGIFPLAFGIVRDVFPAERVGACIGLLSATLGVGGGAGLIVGGLLVDLASFHWIFWVGAILAAIAGVAVRVLVPESAHRQRGKVDVRGALVLGVGLTLPMIAITRANVWGWGSGRTLVLLIAGLVILVGWLYLQRRTPEPMVDVRSLAQRPVLLTNVTTLLVGLGMFGSYLLIPQLLEAPERTGYGSGISATTTALVLLPGAAAVLPLGPLGGMLGARVGNKVPLAIGALVTGVSLVLLGLRHGTIFEVALYNIFISAGVALAYAAMPNLIVEHMPPHQTGEATGFNMVMRSLGASLGAQISAAILAASVVAETGLPSDEGFTWAFIASGVLSLVAFGVALAVPRARRTRSVVATDVSGRQPLPRAAVAPDS